MSLIQVKARDSGPNHSEYHILLATSGQSLNHPQDFCQSYWGRGCKARVTIALCDHTENKAEQSKAELSKGERGRVLVGSRTCPRLLSYLN